MNFLKFFGVLSPAHILLFKLTARGKKIGVDMMGNKYYEAAPRKGYSRPRRWVMYKEEPEASYVPPEWHGWLHHQTDVIPDADKNAPSYRQPWQKPHQPNMTGTNTDHAQSDDERKKATGDYEPWTPAA